MKDILQKYCEAYSKIILEERSMDRISKIIEDPRCNLSRWYNDTNVEELVNPLMEKWAKENNEYPSLVNPKFIEYLDNTSDDDLLNELVKNNDRYTYTLWTIQDLTNSADNMPAFYFESAFVAWIKTAHPEMLASKEQAEEKFLNEHSETYDPEFFNFMETLNSEDLAKLIKNGENIDWER